MRAKVTVCAPRPPVRAAASARASRILWSSARVSSTVPRVSPSSAPASLWRTPGGRMQWNGLRTHIDPRRDPTQVATAESTSLIDQRGFELPPDARTAPRREVARVLRQSGGAQLALRRADVVFELEEARGAAVEVDHERARQRLALARLADAARVQEPSVLIEGELAVVDRPVAAVLAERARQVRVAENQKRRVGMAVRDERELLGRGGPVEDVL